MFNIVCNSKQEFILQRNHYCSNAISKSGFVLYFMNLLLVTRLKKYSAESPDSTVDLFVSSPEFIFRIWRFFIWLFVYLSRYKTKVETIEANVCLFQTFRSQNMDSKNNGKVVKQNKTDNQFNLEKGRRGRRYESLFFRSAILRISVVDWNV